MVYKKWEYICGEDIIMKGLNYQDCKDIITIQMENNYGFEDLIIKFIPALALPINQKLVEQMD